MRFFRFPPKTTPNKLIPVQSKIYEIEKKSFTTNCTTICIFRVFRWELTFASRFAWVLVDDGDNRVSWVRDNGTEDTSNVTSSKSNHQLFRLKLGVDSMTHKYDSPWSIVHVALEQHIGKEQQQSFRSKRTSSLCMGFVSSKVASSP